MFIALISIAVFAGFGWGIRKLFKLPICPICAGVAGTWGWMLVAHYAGYAIDMTVVTLLAGGTPVGIAYTLEKRLPTGRSAMLWKLFIIPTGFAAIYGVLTANVLWLAGGVAAWLTVAAVFFRRTSNVSGNTEVNRFEKGLKDCC
ncbi:MAG: hypothetical protein HYZ07_01405 [Candidatus Harrisonbacteria bacterium]|nr:hypothetical protein [Candidatus Harrisonbacteria bacterium]MBI2604399.1 hypothetical protein [Candidatus Harrisonbacteria bacterium]MBI3114595.1 hypothetical protein [Candidatus Harrisonbacteria bacterium]